MHRDPACRRLPRRSISRALALPLPLPFKAPSKLALRSTSSLKSRFSSPQLHAEYEAQQVSAGRAFLSCGEMHVQE